MIHDRIRRARVLRGLSLEELAKRLGDISKQALNKFEKGEAIPNSTRIIQLAKSLSVKPDFFFRPDTVHLSPLEFRKLSRFPVKKQNSIKEEMTHYLERYIALEVCFEPEIKHVSPPEFNFLKVKSIADAEDAASKLRDIWNIGGDEIANLTETLEDHGIKVLAIEAEKSFDGACAATLDKKHSLIALNKCQAGERMRFTAAHELGHWVMSLPEDMEENDKEKACHRFAGAFLYPKDKVYADFGTHQRYRVHTVELLNAKRRYGISMQAILRRLKDLGLLSDSGYTGMSIVFNRQGWRTQEPESLVAELPRRFEKLVYRGISEDLFTRSRASEFLEKPLAEMVDTYTDSE